MLLLSQSVAEFKPTFTQFTIQLYETPALPAHHEDTNNISARRRHERHGKTAAGYGRENSTQ